MPTSPLNESERGSAAAATAYYILRNAVEIAESVPDGATFTPVEIDHEKREITCIVTAPGTSPSLQRVPELPIG